MPEPPQSAPLDSELPLGVRAPLADSEARSPPTPSPSLSFSLSEGTLFQPLVPISVFFRAPAKAFDHGYTHPSQACPFDCLHTRLVPLTWGNSLGQFTSPPPPNLSPRPNTSRSRFQRQSNVTMEGQVNLVGMSQLPLVPPLSEVVFFSHPPSPQNLRGCEMLQYLWLVIPEQPTSHDHSGT